MLLTKHENQTFQNQTIYLSGQAVAPLLRSVKTARIERDWTKLLCYRLCRDAAAVRAAKSESLPHDGGLHLKLLGSFRPD